MTTTSVTGPRRGARAGLRMTPGRWVTLLLGVPIALALIGWTGFTAVAGLGQSSFPVNAVIPLQHGRLVASVGGADVTLHQDQAGGSTARLTGTVQYSLVRPDFTVSGTDVSLRCRIFTGNCGLSGTLDVPADTPVDVTSGGGNMAVSGLQGGVTLNSGGGDVTVSGIGGLTYLSTGGGNVTASDLGGTLRFYTAGGDVDGNGLSAPHATLYTGGGNVTLVFTSVPRSLEIYSGGGDISVLLPHGATRYDISHDTAGGNYSAASVPADSSSAHTITVVSGGGNVSIAEAR